jgi:cytochrome P450
MATITGFDPQSPEFLADPYPSYAWLRAGHGVYHDERSDLWVLSRYADVLNALRDHQTFSSARGGGPGGYEIPRMLISTDPPDHTLLRSLVSKAFQPRMVAALEPRIRQIAAELVDAVAERGSFDLVQDLSAPLPIIVIAELLGVEPERRHDFQRWSNAFVGLGDEALTLERATSMTQFSSYFAEKIEARRRERRDDLISDLVAAHEDREALSTQDILVFCMLLLVAGNETTTNLLANSALALDRNPEQAARLRAEPSLIPSMIEEALRYDSPVQGFFRRTTRAVEIGGTSLPEDARVGVLYASANRDEEQFPQADRFLIDRSPNNHVAFGYGIHFCLGAPLARLEAKIVWETLLARLPNLRLDPDAPPVRIQNFLLRGLRRLPVLFDPA